MSEPNARRPHGLTCRCDDCEAVRKPYVRLPKRGLTIRERERVELGQTVTLTKEGA